FHIDSALAQLRFRLRKFAPSTVEGRLKRPWINFEQHLSFADECAFFVVLADDVSGDLQANFGIYITIERRHPLALHSHILLDGRGNNRLGSRQLDCRLTAPATNERQDRDDAKNAGERRYALAGR